VKRVALYYPWIYVRSGVERVIFELVRRSRHEYTVFTNHVNFEQTFPEFRTLKRLVVLDGVPVDRSFGSVLRAALTIMTQRLQLEEFDALLVSSEGLGDLITFRNHTRPVLCFCHTPVRPIYDPVYRRVWLERHPRARLALTFYSFFYAAFTRRAWRHYRRVFVNSREVARRVLQGKLCPPEKLEVLHPGVDTDEIHLSPRYERYFACVGRIKWTKNVELAIQAFVEFKATRPQGEEWGLIVAGGVDAGSKSYLDQLQRLSAGDPAVTYHADPGNAELAALYSGCYAVLFPSLNEDWGMVPLEAMAYGKPVLAVNSGGPRESIVDGETGFLLDPTPEAFAERMTWLADRPEAVRRMGAAGTERAKAFSWDAFVRRLDDCIDALG